MTHRIELVRTGRTEVTERTELDEPSRFVAADADASAYDARGGQGGGRDERRARELLWTAAHDLSAPLAAIFMHASAGVGERRSGAEGARDARMTLARIAKLAASAQRLVEDVLTARRLEEQPRGPTTTEIVDAERILSDVIHMQAGSLDRAGCSIFVTRRDDLERVRGRWNPCSLERLFTNLIQNVVRHAPGAGIEVSFARRDDQLRIRFADGGPRLAVASAREGRAFSETPAPESGHGLGLWIVYGIVAEMGGAITMETRAGKGLAFDIRLPFGV